MSINGCELVNSARRLAAEKGLPPGDVRCCFGQLGVCMGTICVMIEEVKNQDRIDGFIVEGHTAGGHNAPARNKQTSDSVPPPHL